MVDKFGRVRGTVMTIVACAIGSDARLLWPGDNRAFDPLGAIAPETPSY